MGLSDTNSTQKRLDVVPMPDGLSPKKSQWATEAQGIADVISAIATTKAFQETRFLCLRQSIPSPAQPACRTSLLGRLAMSTSL